MQEIKVRGKARRRALRKRGSWDGDKPPVITMVKRGRDLR